MEFKVVEIEKLKEAKINSNVVPENIYNKLKKDIKENGCIYPIVIDKNYNIIDGHHRVKVLKELGYDKVNCIVLDIENEKQSLLQAIKLNTERGEQNPKLLALILKELKDEYKLDGRNYL